MSNLLNHSKKISKNGQVGNSDHVNFWQILTIENFYYNDDALQ